MNAYLITYRDGSQGVAIDETGAKARYQALMSLEHTLGRASFADLRSRLLERNVPEPRTWAPIRIELTRWAATAERGGEVE